MTTFPFDPTVAGADGMTATGLLWSCRAARASALEVYTDAITELRVAVEAGVPADDEDAALLASLNERALQAQHDYLDAVGVEAEIAASVAPRAEA